MTSNILYYTFLIPAFLISISVHEFSHAATALAFGDDTAKLQGRVTLNPLKHLNLIGTIMIFLVGFGFANPVPVNPNKFKNRKLGMVCVSSAGPVSNVVMAFLGLVLYSILQKLNLMHILSGFVEGFLNVFIILNISLAVFNILPLPPLDGSNIILPFLPVEIQEKTYKFMPIIYILLIIGLSFDILTPLLRFLVEKVFYGLSFIINLIF